MQDQGKSTSSSEDPGNLDLTGDAGIDLMRPDLQPRAFRYEPP
jgi:hypothetical protein